MSSSRCRRSRGPPRAAAAALQSPRSPNAGRAPQRRRNAPASAACSRSPQSRRRPRGGCASSPTTPRSRPTSTTFGLNEATVAVRWEAELRRARSANISRWSTSIRPAAAATRRSISTIRLLARATACALGGQSAVPSADGLRGRDAHHRPLRAGARPRALWAPRGRRGMTRAMSSEGADRTSSACASIRTRCGSENAYYSPRAKALLFGYFAPSDGYGRDAAGIARLLRLSHDIVAHETTHALLDGLHRRFQRGDQSRRAGLPRGLRRHRRAVPAFHDAGGAAARDRGARAAT